MAGLNWDEGPNVGGNFEDIFKVGIFKEYALKLVQKARRIDVFVLKKEERLED